MNTFNKTVIFAAAVLFAAISCTKETSPNENSPSVPGTIDVCVSAFIGELTPADGTKATISPVIRLNWQNEDKVYAYDATQCLGELSVVQINNNSSAQLEGSISTPAEGTTKITLVYCNTYSASSAPEISNGKISFDLSDQNNGAQPFTVYATLDYTPEQNITGLTIPFKFATSLMRVTVTGMANADIDQVKVNGINTACELTVNADDEPAVAGTTSGTITKTDATPATGAFSRSNDGRAVFNVSVVAENETNANRKLHIKQGSLLYGSDFMSSTIDAGKSIISVYSLTEQTGSRGTINGHDYVFVAGRKWATQNIAVSESGRGAWQSAKVPGKSDENVVLGDYFQWAAYPGYCGNSGDTDKGLLVYGSFTSSSSSISFTFKQGKQFKKDYAPYGGTDYTRYNNTDNRNLDFSDDIARTLWGGSWRLPTGGDNGEFKELFAATYWKWDSTDKGYYIYAPNPQTDAGKTNDDGKGSYNKQDALLFFPACGYYHEQDSFSNFGNYGHYWSSTLNSDHKSNAYNLRFQQGRVSYPGTNYQSRANGHSVRPVSD